MAKQNQTKNALALFFIAILAASLSFTLSVFVHESGHWLVGSLFYAENVKVFSVPLDSLIKNLVCVTTNNGFRVEYAHTGFPWGFTPVQGALVALAGGLFQLALLVVIGLLLRSILRKEKIRFHLEFKPVLWALALILLSSFVCFFGVLFLIASSFLYLGKNTEFFRKREYTTSALIGFYVGLVGLIYSWWGDVATILMHWFKMQVWTASILMLIFDFGLAFLMLKLVDTRY